ncbi:hypothetical protein SteCoe_2033 [Stentor coeruleus]|uniref:F5/8 type C domain-containing protein n=1 Tax=Stentor coeruleus TaxID=5963 RepID=A0A1R2D0A7_9CILI|nr:hypothetical protein SteCoe_2033 [Stentor coeruleus]
MYLPKKCLAIGNTCVNNYYYQVKSFDVKPWPPDRGKNITIDMGGVFHQSVTVADIGIGQSINNQSWKYSTVTVNQAFSNGESHTFSTAIPAGSDPGSYYIQYSLKGLSDIFIACWSFEYQLS